MSVRIRMATDSSCSIKRIKELNYLSKYLKTHFIHQASDLSIVTKHFVFIVFAVRKAMAVLIHLIFCKVVLFFIYYN